MIPRSAILALGRDNLRRNQALAWSIPAIILFGAGINCLLPESLFADVHVRECFQVINWLLTALCLGLVFAVFNCTEYSPGKEWHGFPYRQFILPLPTWLLTAVPVVLGVAGVEVVLLACARCVLFREAHSHFLWVGCLLGTMMVLYQMILWTLAGFRLARMLALAFTATGVLTFGLLPAFERFRPEAFWTSEANLIPLLAAMSLAGYGISWNSVARQRSGGGQRRNLFAAFLDRALDRLPSRRRLFASASSAHIWYEWRRSGWILPACVTALLILMILPISWSLRGDPGGTVWTLLWTLALPLILAAALGHGFSAPDFWSRERDLPSFIATRPLASGEWIVCKMKVAVWSATLSWAAIVLFLCVWLPCWADTSMLSMFRVPYWMVYGHTNTAQYAIAALALLFANLLTWKFLIGSMNTKMSGPRRFFIFSSALFVTSEFVDEVIQRVRQQRVRRAILSRRTGNAKNVPSGMTIPPLLEREGRGEGKLTIVRNMLGCVRLSIILQACIPIVAVTALIVGITHDEQVKAFARKYPDDLVAAFEWAAVLAVTMKFWSAAFSWRRISQSRTWNYLALWICATLVIAALGLLLWAHGAGELALMQVLDILPVDSLRLGDLLLLLVLLAVPLARIGRSRDALASNRHR